MSQTMRERLDLARIVAAGAAVRVKARKDYASDNMFAVDGRRRELRTIVQRICIANQAREDVRRAG